VGGEKRKKGGEKQIQPSSNGGTYDNINWSRLQHFVKDGGWVFLDIGGGVMRRPNDTDNLHKLTRSYPALTASFFVFFL